MPWLLGVLMIAVLGYLCLALFYYLFQERFIFIRFRTRLDHAYRFNAPHVEQWMDRPDGARLHALLFPVAKPRGVVLFFHGHSGSLRRWGKYATRFTELGYAVLMPDPRGYGKSRGKSSEAALIADALAWYDHLRKDWQEADIVPYGRSLGSAFAVPVAAQRSPRLLILETPFASMIDAARFYLPILPYKLLLRYPFHNDEVIRQVRCPVYIFHGKRDQVVPYSSALRLYAAVPSTVQRELFTFKKGHHSDLHRFARFRNTLRRILHDQRGAGPEQH